MNKPPPLPDALLDEATAVKLLWLWLRPQGVVSYAQRDMARTLGVSQAVVSTALARLRALGFVLERAEATGRGQMTLEAVEP